MWGKKNKADKDLDALIKEDDIKQRQESIDLLHKVELLRDQIPTGTKVTILGKDMLVNEVYSNYPSIGFEVKLIYFNDVTGNMNIAKLPFKTVEDHIEKTE